MSFAEFQTRLDIERNRYEAYRVRALRDMANDYDLETDMDIREQSIYELIAEIQDVLETDKPLSFEMDKLICLIADNLMDDLEPDKGILHTCLRHIDHQARGIEYSPRIQEKLSKEFNKNGVMAFSAAQYFSFKRDGSIGLNNWGRLVLGRLDDAQLLEAHYSPDQGISQTYSIQDLL